VSDAADLTGCTATELLALYRSGSASPVEATRAVLDRIDRINPTINAFCYLAPDDALSAAAASESRWMRAEPIGPLDGVPVSIKDLVLTRGWPTLRGSHTVDPDQAWDVDAPATARLRDAGAVLLGKTTTPEFGCKGETNSDLTGITRNPWDPTKTSGGSSGGTAAAVAAGLGPLSIGTDGAGSVRIPAAFCGNVGLKPSFGRVPAYPPSPFGTVSHLGPHTMSVADAALMMNTLTRPDNRDWTSLPFADVDHIAGLDDGIAGWRIAYSPTLGYVDDVDPEVADAVDTAARALTDLGAHVEQVDPGFDCPLEITTGLWFTGAWTLWNQLSPEQHEVTDPDFRAEAMLGSQLSNLDVQLLNLRRSALGSQLRQFMEQFDLIVTPSVAVPAFDAVPAGSRPMTPESMLGWTPFSYPFNLSQQPACTIPCGLTRDGLPVGLQLVGPMFADAAVLRAARAYETVRPITRPPLLA
jgi:aspartyl-tRNA(Asn)/glutamyl-tRNA(Gln) amidotransferase subunit A